MKSLLVLSSLLLLSSNVFAGQDKGNGGFLYSRTSKKLLDISQASLLTELDSVLKNRKELTYTSSACSKPVDLRELNSIVSDLTYNYEAQSVGVNPEGKEEKRYFHINNENKVEATELYFASFIDTSFRYSESTDADEKQKIIAPIRTAIIHESLHLFDYGEMESRSCADDVVSVLESYAPSKLEQKIKEVDEQNNKLIEEALAKSGCMTEESFAKDQRWVDAYRGADGEEMIDNYSRGEFGTLFDIAAGTLNCVSTKIGFKKEEYVKVLAAKIDRRVHISGKADRDNTAMVYGFMDTRFQAKSLKNVATYLNKIMKFPFEIESPKAK
ncbi:MAG: hypothetical protein Q7T79_01330 [bacterium]|nr:hypothetical protein [bacterium]